MLLKLKHLNNKTIVQSSSKTCFICINMSRLYFAVIITVLIIISHTTNAFFLQNLANITVTRTISCRQNDNTTSTGDFQFCAIRVYIGPNGMANNSFIVYNGLRYLNTLRPFIQTRCPDFVFVQNGNTVTDIGAGSCGQPRIFETFSQFQLCICATDNCNQDYDSCINSTSLNNNITQLSDFMPILNATIQCDDTLNASNICQEQPFINVSLCEDYVRNNSVLCAITVNGTTITQTPLIYEDYEMYLSEKIYEARSAINGTTGSSYNETQTNVYYAYPANDAESIEECACTSYSLCNQNINTCLSQTALPTDTTMLTTSFMSDSSGTFASDYSSSTLIPTSEIITTIPITSVNSTAITTIFTDSTIITTPTASDTINSFTDSTTPTQLPAVTSSSVIGSE